MNQYHGFMTDVVVAAYGGSVDPRSRESLLLIEDIVKDEMQETTPGSSQLRLAELYPYLKAYRTVRQYPILLPLGAVVAAVGVAGIFYYLGITGRRK